MASIPPKAPPRFVPTLTDVVQVAEAEAPLQPRFVLPAAAAPSLAAGLPAAPVPDADRFMPVAPPPWAARSAFGAGPVSAPMFSAPMDAQPAAPAVVADAAPAVPLPIGPSADPLHVLPAFDVPPSTTALPEIAVTAASLPHGFEEHLVHRVMQRVDVVLDQRLREAIATVVQEQTRSMVPRLREEVESVVRHAVYEAVAEELSGERDPSL